jgi:multiple antibiotic resistance protein
MLRDFMLTFIAIFVALDVVGTLPIYASITSAMIKPEKAKIVDTSMLVAFVVAVVFLFLGTAIFRFLGITIGDFKIAGGIVLLLISLTDLVGQPEVEKRASGSTGIVPLAVPLITGPGVLTTLVLQARSAGYLLTLAALSLNYVLAWGLLHKSDGITRKIGKDGTTILSKIAALLLAAIAVAMIRTGIVEAFPKLLGG